MTSLRNIRESLGFSLEEVAAATGWPLARLDALEASGKLDDEVDTVLGDLYGVDVYENVQSGGTSPLATLLRGQAGAISATARFAIAEASTVARQVRVLQAELGLPNTWLSLDPYRHDSDYSSPRSGNAERLAIATRKALRIVGPVVSVFDQLYAPLGVLVLSTCVDDRFDAFCMATPDTGPVVVLNLNGAHADNAFGRRITLAHELCHLLYDRPKLQSMRRFCAISFGTGRKCPPRDEEDEIERRARAFAAWLLAPRAEMTLAWHQSGDLGLDRRVRHIMTTFGIGYQAARAHLGNLGRVPLRQDLPDVDTAAPPRWERADPPPPLNESALRQGVSELRAGALLDILLQALRANLVGEEFVRGNLRIDIPAWERLRSDLGLPSERTWRTSSALPMHA